MLIERERETSSSCSKNPNENDHNLKENVILEQENQILIDE